MRTDEPLTLERAKELLSYNQRTGSLTWKVNRRGTVKAGDVAGGRDGKGLLIVTIDNKVYPAARLAWLLAKDQWPRGRIRFRNRKVEDLRMENLVDEGNMPSVSRSAAYLRTYRRDMKIINHHIQENPELLEEYLNADPDMKRGILGRERQAMRLRLRGHKWIHQPSETIADKHRREAVEKQTREEEERLLYEKLKAKFEKEHAP